MVKHIIITLLFSALTHLCLGQDYTIVEKDGEKYYSHHVEAGHTLYAIALLYDSEEEVIRSYNEILLQEGLKVGQTIFIPVSPDFKAGVIKNPIRIEDGFMVHKVLKKETLFSICKTYTVDINDVLALNPEADASGIKKGQELKIPVNNVNGAVTVAPPVTFNASKWKTHTVLPGETLYGVSKKYEVSIKEILDINDGLPEGLKASQVINIPILIEKEEQIENTGSVTEVVDTWRSKRDTPYKDTYDVALTLPLYISSLDSGGLTLKEKRIQKVSLSFYRGAFLAAQKLEKEGLSMNMHVMDVVDDVKKTRVLASNEEFHKMDLFIGPFQKKPLAKVIEIAEGSGAHVVCPTPQSGKMLLSHSNVSKVTPSGSTMMGEMGEFLAADSSSPNVILIKTKWVKDKRNIQVFEKSYNSFFTDSISLAKRSLKVIDAEKLNASSLKALLSESRKNIVVMPTEEKISLSRLVNVLPFIRSNYDMSIVLTDRWTNNEYLDADLRNKFNVQIPSHFTFQYNSEKMMDFSEEYDLVFDDVIDEYAVLGHDIMLYYGRGLKDYGVNFNHYFAEISQEGLVDYKFDFEAVGPDSGYENHGIHFMRFEDYELKETILD